jgi:hypothetical protein
MIMRKRTKELAVGGKGGGDLLSCCQGNPLHGHTHICTKYTQSEVRAGAKQQKRNQVIEFSTSNSSMLLCLLLAPSPKFCF